MRNPLDIMIITQPFGVPVDYMEGGYHWGVDLRGNKTPVYAIEDGWVLRATESNKGYGNQVRLFHRDNTILSLYAHLNSIKVKEKDKVHQGDIIGTVGNTGNSTAPHLHFEIRLNGKPIDPIKFLNKKNMKYERIRDKFISKFNNPKEDETFPFIGIDKNKQPIRCLIRKTKEGEIIEKKDISIDEYLAAFSVWD